MEIVMSNGQRVDLWTPDQVAQWRVWRFSDTQTSFKWTDPDSSQKMKKIQKAVKFHGANSYDSVINAVFSLTSHVAHCMDFHYSYEDSFASYIPDWMAKNKDAQKKFAAYLIEFLMALGWVIEYDPEDMYTIKFLPCLPFTEEEIDMEVESSVKKFASAALSIINIGMKNNQTFYSLGEFNSLNIPPTLFEAVIDELKNMLSPHWKLVWHGGFPSGYEVVSLKKPS